MERRFEGAVLEVLVDETLSPPERGEPHPHRLYVRIFGKDAAGDWITPRPGVVTRAHAEPEVDENDQAAVPESLFDHLSEVFSGVDGIGYDGEFLDPDETVPTILDEVFTWTCHQACQGPT
ncbi:MULTISPECIES: hypothetical protein [Nocardiopsis]|jgi:hypothetical protein|uniref:Uncharacterized protein n=3 Tax=Nocardiopsis alba TaxID=53437 RepID=A0A7K2IT89_9ACTN|nr:MULTISPECIES: hypothetical protein [Nocardiopsis]AFR08013.1 hypothetical protein B005_2092 [Nocardiopsis alba ATCC BAA-2165]MYR33005.1 hypothetical protein [Nocardiopsis alba]